VREAMQAVLARVRPGVVPTRTALKALVVLKTVGDGKRESRLLSIIASNKEGASDATRR